MVVWVVHSFIHSHWVNNAALLFMRWTKCCGYFYTIRTFCQYLLQISGTWRDVVAVISVAVVVVVSNSLWYFSQVVYCYYAMFVTQFVCYTSALAV